MTTLLAVDIGNTNVTLGAFEGETLTATWRFSTDPSRTEDEIALMISGLLAAKGVDPADADAAAMCSVVPPITELVESALRSLIGNSPLVIGPGVKTGIRISYDRTQDVGTDRVVDAVAAHTLYGGPAIIVDIGTGTVFDAVTADGEYIGGAIAPGLQIAADAMYQRTAQLRRVELVAPDCVIGRSTVASMQSGLIYGYVDLVDGMVRRFRNELSPDDPGACTVVATGGLAGVIAPHVDCFDHVNDDLTLEGLRLVHELNSSQ